MKRISYLTILLLFLSLKTFSQQIINNTIGYQESSTIIQDQTADPLGNIYYWGSYKGALTINGQFIEVGRGGFDFFICKTDNNGNLIWYKTFGGPVDDPGFGVYVENRTILFDENFLYVVWRVNPEGGTIENYTNTTPNETGVFAKFDANNGTIIWQHNTNLIYWHIEKNSDGFSLFGNTGEINYVYDQISGSTGLLNNPDNTSNVAFVLKTDINGNLSWYKPILPNSGGTVSGYLNFLNIDIDGNGNYKMILQTDGESISIGETLIPIEGGPNYKNIILVSASADFSSINSKTIIGPTGAVSRINLTAIGQNSYYFIFEFWAGENYSYNGNSIQTSLSTYLLEIANDYSFKNWYILNENNNFNGFNVARFIEMFESDDKLYFIANYFGKNNSAFTNFAPDPETRSIFRSFSPTLDKNGADRTFLISSSLDLTNIETLELTNEKPLGPYNFFPLQKDIVVGGRYYFLHAGTKWNPWIIEGMNSIVKKSFDNTSDGPDQTLAISYFDDGSRLVIGYAQGRTQFAEENQNRRLNNDQQDLFIARIGVNNEVIWYKRALSSFSFPNNFSQKKSNNTIQIIFNPGDSYSRSLGNTYQLDGKEITRASSDPNDNFKLYLEVGLNGVITLKELNYLKQGGPVSRSIVNQNLLVDYSSSSTANEVIGTKSFISNGVSSYLMTLNPITNTRIDGIQISPQLQSSGITFDPSDNSVIILSRVTFPASAIQLTKNYRLNISPTQFQDFSIQSIAGITTAQTLAVLIKVNLSSGIVWIRRFGPNVIIQPPHNGLCANNDGIVLNFLRGNGQLFLDDQPIQNLPNPQFGINRISTIIKLNSQGALQNYNQIDLQIVNEFKLKQVGSSYFLIGSNSSIGAAGQIPIGNSGETDALSIELDNQLNVLNVYRLASPFFERMTDLDIYTNKISFTYWSQTTPSLVQGGTTVARVQSNITSENQIAEAINISSILEKDLQEDGGIFEADRCQPVKWYKDEDGDGFGNKNIFIETCTQPIGYVTNDSDCDDTEKTLEPCPCPTITWTKEWDKKDSKLNDSWFNLKFPTGIIIGSQDQTSNYVKFTNAKSIKDYLPGESGLSTLNRSYTNPTKKNIKNSLVTQLIYVRLNMANNPGLKNSIITKGSYKSITVEELNSRANTLLSSKQSIDKKILKSLFETLEKINESYDYKKQSGFLQCALKNNDLLITTQSSTNSSYSSKNETKLYIIYPNPSSNKFLFQNKSKNNVSISIINSMGSNIETLKNVSPNNEIQFGNTYLPGIYIVHVLLNDKISESFRVIKL